MNLKPFNELTDEEVLALTAEDKEWYFQRLAMENGIKIAVDPGEEPRKPDIVPELSMLETSMGTFSVNGNDLYFTDGAAFAELLSLLLKLQKNKQLFCEKYDYNVGYEFKYADDVNILELSTSTRQVFSKKRYNEIKGQLAEYVRQKNEWNSLHKLWREYQDALTSVTDYIRERVENVRSLSRQRLALIPAWRKYEAMDESKTTAIKFFKTAYAEELESAECTAEYIVDMAESAEERRI